MKYFYIPIFTHKACGSVRFLKFTYSFTIISNLQHFLSFSGYPNDIIFKNLGYGNADNFYRKYNIPYIPNSGVWPVCKNREELYKVIQMIDDALDKELNRPIISIW